MNTDCKKPPLAPKPRLHGQVHLKLPSPLISRACFAARTSKPPLAPKPKVATDVDGTESLLSNPLDGCFNGGLVQSEEELDQDNDPDDSLRQEGKEAVPVEPHFGSYSLNSGVYSSVYSSENGSSEELGGEVMVVLEIGGEERMREEEESWRLSDAALTEELDSLDPVGFSDAGFTTDSADAAEMIDTDLTEDIDVCDAGEALADTDGLSVGDFSVTSVEEEEVACCSSENETPTQKDREAQEEEAREIKLLSGEEAPEADTTVHKQLFFPTRENAMAWKQEEPSPYSCSSLGILKVECGIKVMGSCQQMDPEEETEISSNVSDGSGYSEKRVERYQACSIINEERLTFRPIIDKHHLPLVDAEESLAASETDPALEPYYISSDDVIETGLSHGPHGGKVTPEPPSLGDINTMLPCEYEAIGDTDSLGGQSDTGQIECVSSEDYVEIGSDDDSDDRDENTAAGRCPKRTSIGSDEHRSQIMEALLNRSNSQPRVRLVSLSFAADPDASLVSSLSGSQLLSPSDSDVFHQEDLEGHIVPYLDETTDTEQDLSDEHLYEEAGLDSEGENFLPFDRKAMVMRSRSLSGKVPGYVPETVPEEGTAEAGLQKCSAGEADLAGPALSSSPMLSSGRAKTSGRLQRFSLYPRSFSVEGRDVPLCVFPVGGGSPRERREDSLSLPCVIDSSGSFSRRSPLPSSGLSTPTSVVDIPPPFELAYITKKPITKSFPSLFIEGDSPDPNKKKKSSFKRFLMLKFKRKAESKGAVDVKPSSSRSSSESSHHAPGRLLDVDRRSTGGSPQLRLPSVSNTPRSPDSLSTFLFYKDGKSKGGSVAFLNRSVARVESFEERSRGPFTPLPLTKPRSISFPNADTSDYENVPAIISSDYENIQVPSRRPLRPGTLGDFFDPPTRVLSSANETDGYVDMSSFPGFESKAQLREQETESAYTEAYNVCSLASSPATTTAGDVGGGAEAEEDQGRTSEEEEGGLENNYDRQTDGRSRAFYIAKDLVDSERLHVKALKLLQEDFREAVGAAVGEEGDQVLEEDRLREILNELPDVYTLHRRILTELENRIRQWEESQRIADVILSRRAEFVVYTTYIGHYDRSMSLLEESCRTSPAFAAIVRQFEQQSPVGENLSLKHQLLQVIVRVAQYRMLLTDYLNNLSPDSKEYEDTQAAVVIVSDIADQANDSLKDGENLLRLVNIEYSVRGQRDLLQPGRVFVKEGTLMKVSRKSRQPRHLFLMNDVMLYTYPQQDGKYRLKNTLLLTGMKVTKPVIENVQNALKIETADISIILSASSCSERDDWFYTLSRTVSDHARGPAAFHSGPGESRDRLWLSLGEKAPTLVPVSQVMMCMNCTSDFSLTLRRHHCHACGRIVCRSCSRNRYPLKYMKGRVAKVCDHCYSELKKRGGDVCELTGNNSPRPNRSSRPLSAVFQNLHPPSLWRHRKGTVTFMQVSVPEDGSISGTLQRSKRSKRNWKRLWFRLKDKVLYTYRAREEKVATESLPLLGFTVKLPDRPEGDDQANVFQLYHKKTLFYTFKAEDNHTAQRWVNAMEEATVL